MATLLELASQPTYNPDYYQGSGYRFLKCYDESTSIDSPKPCPHCSNGGYLIYHYGPCPRIKSIEYHPNGQIKKIEFKEEGIV